METHAYIVDTAKKEKMIFAIDFDGTLCDSSYPNCGEPIADVVETVKELKRRGHYIILYTCRHGKPLANAIKWCSKQGLTFDAVNENLPDLIKIYGNTRKVFADFYVDNANLTIEGFLTEYSTNHGSRQNQRRREESK